MSNEFLTILEAAKSFRTSLVESSMTTNPAFNADFKLVPHLRALFKKKKDAYGPPFYDALKSGDKALEILSTNGWESRPSKENKAIAYMTNPSVKGMVILYNSNVGNVWIKNAHGQARKYMDKDVPDQYT
tara:strand:+ start:20473 stop:20862 length:390 start_codon:yes stop_codon:yes gene_type:complete